MKAREKTITRAAFKGVLTLFLVMHGTATSQKITFSHLTAKQGLSQGSVTSIAQDKLGFMWFGTYDGITRYDGINFKIYKTDAANPNSLSYNFVRSLLIDKSGVMWIGTAGGGLNRFIPETDSFVHCRHDAGNPSSISHDHIYALFEDHHRNLWVGTWGGGLNRVVLNDAGKKKENPGKDSLTFIHYRHDPLDPNSLADDKITSICEDSSGLIWIGTRSGISILDPEKDCFIRRYGYQPSRTHSLSGNNISALSCDPDGNIWIGTWDDGLNLYNPESGRFTSFYHDPDNKNSLSHNIIMNLYADHSGNIWIGTWGGGLNRSSIVSRLRNQKRPFYRYEHHANDPQSIAGNSIYAVFEDRSGVLWVGTDWNGVSRYDRDQLKFTHYQYDPNDPNGLTDNVILALWKDPDNMLWIGTNGGGLNTLNMNTDRYRHYSYDPADPSSISSNTVRAISRDPRGRYWLGTDRGLNLFDIQNGTSRRFYIEPGNKSSTHITAICEDRGFLWLGTWGNGLSRFDTETRKFITWLHDPADSASISDNIIYSLCMDSKNRLWIGTSTGGLNRFDPKSGRFLRYMHDEKDTASVIDNKILCMLEDREGSIWLGTTAGLNRMIPDENPDSNPVFKRYTVKNGLLTNTVQGLLEDAQGNLWISNGDVMTVFNPKTGKIRGYDAYKRLQAGEFSINAVFKDPKTGEMIIGSVNGFNVFHPDSISDNPVVPYTAITNLKIFNRPVQPLETSNGRVILEKSIPWSDQIVLAHKDNVITLEYAALQYNAPENNQYAFMLEGFEKEWNQVGSGQRMATYTNLDPGKYTFRVKASNHDGVWDEQGTALQIIVTPPFWRTWWFTGLAILLTGLFVYGFIEYRTWGINKQREKLEKEVRERTKDLKTAYEELEIQKNQLIRNTEALKQSNQELEQFAYVASHDLQEPLRMISAYSMLLERELGDKLKNESRDFLFYMSDGAKRMQNLINDLLAFSRITTQGKPFVLKKLNDILAHALKNLQAAVEEKQAVVTSGELPEIMCDPLQIERVFQNLISNAIKYCERKPQIHVFSIRKDGRLEIGIRDNGIGIDPKYTDKIFGIFKRLHHRDEYSGTGIGLAVCKKIVERHGGQIRVESAEGVGSTFILSFSDSILHSAHSTGNGK